MWGAIWTVEGWGRCITVHKTSSPHIGALFGLKHNTSERSGTMVGFQRWWGEQSVAVGYASSMASQSHCAYYAFIPSPQRNINKTNFVSSKRPPNFVLLSSINNTRGSYTTIVSGVLFFSLLYHICAILSHCELKS